MSRIVPSDANNRTTSLMYLTCHPVWIMAIIRIITRYHVVVNGNTTLSITCLQIS